MSVLRAKGQDESFEYESKNGTKFFAEKQNLAGGVYYHAPHNIHPTQLNNDFAEFGMWYGRTIHIELKEHFAGFGSVKYISVMPSLVSKNFHDIYAKRGNPECEAVLNSLEDVSGVSYTGGDDKLYTEYYVILDSIGQEDYLANVQFSYEPTTHTMTVSFTTDDEDNGNLCQATFSEAEIEYVQKQMQSLVEAFKLQFNQQPFENMTWVVEEQPKTF